MKLKQMISNAYNSTTSFFSNLFTSGRNLFKRKNKAAAPVVAAKAPEPQKATGTLSGLMNSFKAMFGFSKPVDKTDKKGLTQQEIKINNQRGRNNGLRSFV